MQPDIGHIIQGIKRCLSEEILPAVNEQFAREQIAYSMFLCEHLATRWDQAHIVMAQQDADLRASLSAAVEIAQRCTAPSRELRALLDSTAIELATDSSIMTRSLRAVEAGIIELKRALVHLVDACAELGDADATAVREVLRGFMKRQLARDEEWVSNAMIGWW